MGILRAERCEEARERGPFVSSNDPPAWIPGAKDFNCPSVKSFLAVPVVAQWIMNPTRNDEVAGSIPGLAQWVKDPALP